MVIARHKIQHIRFVTSTVKRSRY